ncbi:MAG TPA: nucleotidyltransferase domain-containing protein [bacterium]
MKDFDYKKARQFLEKKEQDRKQFLDKKFNQACQDFKKIIDFIILKYNPKKIYQWGSLLNREHFSEISDIDIALEGITSAEQLFEIYGAIMNMSDFSIDLIQIEKIEPEFAELIIKNGRVVYERSE